MENVDIVDCNMNVNRTASKIGGIAGINKNDITGKECPTSIDNLFECEIKNTSFFGNGDIGGAAGVNYEGCSISNIIFEGDASVYNITMWYVDDYENSAGRSIGGIVGYNQLNAVVDKVVVRNIKFLLEGDALINHDPRVGYVIGENKGHLNEYIMKNVSNKQEGDFALDSSGWFGRKDHKKHKKYLFAYEDGAIGFNNLG